MIQGTLVIPVTRWKSVTIIGGPYFDKPEGMYGVKMAVEIEKPCDYDIPTKDFQVPDDWTLRDGVVVAMAYALRTGKPIYVGCMGGIGRTGLFMAAAAKAAGVPFPVDFVRSNYIPHAVETDQQRHFIDDFEVDPSELQEYAKSHTYFTDFARCLMRYAGAAPRKLWDAYFTPTRS